MLIDVRKPSSNECILIFNDYKVNIICSGKFKDVRLEDTNFTVIGGCDCGGEISLRVNSGDLRGTQLEDRKGYYLDDCHLTNKRIGENECFIVSLRKWYCYVITDDKINIEEVYVFRRDGKELIRHTKF